ncbi:MAG: site-2 protease family protein, partial [Synergistaceae bacterium]|nr:site-2 protease family protein [Synergistaceae bacterium]
SSAVFISFILDFFNTFVVINLSLAFFNLVPIPPLDGSKILDAALPAKASWYYNQISRFGFLILIVLINTPVLNYPLSFLVSRTYMLFHNVIGLIPFL